MPGTTLGGTRRNLLFVRELVLVVQRCLFSDSLLGQMGFHAKPCGLLNVNGFYTPLDLMLDTAEKEGFLKIPHQQSIIRAENPAEMLDLLQKATENKPI